jgi:hypothetical protein
VIGWLARLLRHHPDLVSSDWLRDLQRREREEFHGPRMQWPVKKIMNDSALWNREKLRKRA